MAAVDSFRAFADCLREPAILVSIAGDVVALNAAAAALLGVDPAAAPSSWQLGDFLDGGRAALDEFIRTCARTRRPTVASIALRGASGHVHACRAEGVLYQRTEPSEPATVFIRLVPGPEADPPLVTGNERLRPIADDRAATPQLVNVNELVTTAAALLRPLVGRSTDLVTRLAPRAPLVRVDTTQIERVLVNLGVYARDQMEEGGRLTIETGRDKQVATIVLSDSGPAPSPAALARLFEPWSPGASAVPRSGISLASSRAAIVALGGSLTAASGGSAGTSFTIRLPIATEPGDSAATDPVTVLVVDDDDTARDLIADSLLSVDFRVLCASDGAAAVELAQRHPGPIDLLVTDVVMPKMNGPRVAQTLRERYPRLRVLYLSGYSDGVDLPMHTPGAPAAFLAKPFTRGTLLGRVQTLLGK